MNRVRDWNQGVGTLEKSGREVPRIGSGRGTWQISGDSWVLGVSPLFGYYCVQRSEVMRRASFVLILHLARRVRYSVLMPGRLLWGGSVSGLESNVCASLKETVCSKTQGSVLYPAVPALAKRAVLLSPGGVLCLSIDENGVKQRSLLLKVLTAALACSKRTA